MVANVFVFGKNVECLDACGGCFWEVKRRREANVFVIGENADLWVYAADVYRKRSAVQTQTAFLFAFTSLGRER